VARRPTSIKRSEMEIFEWLYKAVFETVFETNFLGFVGVFALGAAFQLCVTVAVTKLVQKRTKKQVRETARVGRLRAKRSWDA
jgi:ribosomal protein S17E